MSGRSVFTRWRTFASLAALAGLLLPLHAQQQPAVAIRARAMVDVDGGRLIDKATVVIRGRAAPAISTASGCGAQTHSARGCAKT